MYRTLILNFILAFSLAAATSISPTLFAAQTAATMYSTRAAIKTIHLTEEQLRELAKDLAPKVNLFRAVWAIDPKAELVAGTSRDFLYWIMRQFRGLESDRAVLKKMKELRAISTIDVKDFVSAESDCDIISSYDEVMKIEPGKYGLRKIDTILPDRFKPKTKVGKSEVDQGYIPLEKMRLSQNGINEPDHFGNPVAEIISGKLSVNFSPDKVFWQTHYALMGMNHPVLLAVRYVRLLAQDYFNRYGDEKPNEQLLESRLESEIELAIKKIFHDAMSDSRFAALLDSERGSRFLNGSLLKSFRNYTNPDASLYFFKKLGFQELQAHYHDKIEPLNQFLFKQHRDEELVKQNWQLAKLDEEKMLLNVQDIFTGLKFLHGTRSEAAFRAIILQGILPSRMGQYGPGLYGVPTPLEGVASNYAGGRDTIIEFDIDPKTRVMNEKLAVTLETKWRQETGRKSLRGTQGEGRASDEFCEAFGIDILWVPGSQAIVKNSAVLSKARGKYRSIKSTRMLLEEINSVSDIPSLIKAISDVMMNGVDDTERNVLLSNIAPHHLKKVNEINFSDQNFDEAYASLSLINLLTPEKRAELAAVLAKNHLPQLIEKISKDEVSVDFLPCNIWAASLGAVDSSELAKAILNSKDKKARDWLIGRVLWREQWTAKPELIADIIATAKTEDDVITIWTSIFRHPYWQKFPDLIDSMADKTLRMIEQEKMKSFMVGEMAHYLEIALQLSPKLQKALGIKASEVRKLGATITPPANQKKPTSTFAETCRKVLKLFGL